MDRGGTLWTGFIGNLHAAPAGAGSRWLCSLSAPGRTGVNLFFIPQSWWDLEKSGIPGQADPAIAGLIALGRKQQADEAAAAAAQAAAGAAELIAPLASASADAKPGVKPSPLAVVSSAKPGAKPAEVAVTIQFASPDARAVDAALAALRGVPGANGVATTSLAIGGTSVMRAGFAGTPAELAALLRARGWQVSVSGAVLKIRR